MGISLDTALALIANRRDRELGGRCLTLGKQDIDFTLVQLVVAMNQRGWMPRKNDVFVMSAHEQAAYNEFQSNGRMLAQKAEAAQKQHLSDEFFFRFIGFTEARSVDFSAFEGADFTFDLNEAGMAEVTGTYDFVYDGGTMEHVFHVPNVLLNIHQALKIGGTVTHHSPSNNMLDHGFYQFSPTLFFDYYHVNGYEDIEVHLGRSYKGLTFSMRYQPGTLNTVSAGGLDDATYGTAAIARKGPASTFDRIPQQGVYTQIWSRS